MYTKRPAENQFSLINKTVMFLYNKGEGVRIRKKYLKNVETNVAFLLVYVN